MKKKILTALLIIETVLLLVILTFGLLYFNTRKAETEIYRQSSEDGSQNVVIYGSENQIGRLALPIIKYMDLQIFLSMFLMMEEAEDLLSNGRKLL